MAEWRFEIMGLSWLFPSAMEESHPTKKADRVAAMVADLAIEATGAHDARYLGFFQCFNRGDYYEAHDVLEDLWLETQGPDREFHKGLIQVAGAFVHLRKQHEHPEHHHHGRRLVPAARLFRIAADRLTAYAPAHLGVDVAGLVALCEACLARIEAGSFLDNPWSPESKPGIHLSPVARG
jgi:predicted metal-dependent hydrolase